MCLQCVLVNTENEQKLISKKSVKTQLKVLISNFRLVLNVVWRRVTGWG
jgi:hypothetical protein